MPVDTNDRKELTQAAGALEQWFKSQDIDPPDAIFVIANLLARQVLKQVKAMRTAIEVALKLKAFPELVKEAVRLELAECSAEQLLSSLDDLPLGEKEKDLLRKMIKAGRK